MFAAARESNGRMCKTCTACRNVSWYVMTDERW